MIFPLSGVLKCILFGEETLLKNAAVRCATTKSPAVHGDITYIPIYDVRFLETAEITLKITTIEKPQSPSRNNAVSRFTQKSEKRNLKWDMKG